MSMSISILMQSLHSILRHDDYSTIVQEEEKDLPSRSLITIKEIIIGNRHKSTTDEAITRAEFIIVRTSITKVPNSLC
jgi:hypothetical protein